MLFKSILSWSILKIKYKVTEYQTTKTLF